MTKNNEWRFFPAGRFGITTALVVAASGIGLVASAQVSRSAGVKENRAFMYHGKLVRPDGSSPTGSMQVTLKVLSPDPGLCVLWSETQTITVDGGGFAVEIGHSVNRLPGASGGAASDFKQAFINNPSLTISGAQCATGSSYTPSGSDDRLLSASFNDQGTVIDITGLPIKSVPFALQAEEIGGYGLMNLAKISGAGSSVTYSPAEVQTLKDMLGGTVDWDLQNRKIKNLANPVSAQDAATKSWVESHVAASMSGAGLGTVTSVSVSGLPLSVTNATSAPQLSITQANATTAGYLSSADWNAFNGKQPAGAYLTSITSGNVTTALGFTPVSNALTNGQVIVGNGSNLAAGGYLGIGQLRNNLGTLQMPASCTAAQTLTWSAVTDVLACTNITISSAAVSGLGALASKSAVNLASTDVTGVLPPANHGTGTADATKYLRGDGTWQTLPSGADNLGNHTASQNLNLAAFKLVGNGGSNGIMIDSTGNVGIGTTSPVAPLDVTGVVRMRNSGNTNYLEINPTAMSISPWSGGLAVHGVSLGWANDPAGGATEQVAPVENGRSFYFSTAAGKDLFLGPGRNTIFSSGNVGIGTTSPGDKLSIVGGNLELRDPATQSPPVINFVDTAGTLTIGKLTTNTLYASQRWKVGAGTVGSPGLGFTGDVNSGIYLPAASNLGFATAGVERVRVDGSGNVGIGTTSPGYKLDVAGDINVTGNFKVNGTNIASGTMASLNGSSVAAQTFATPGTAGTAPAWSTNTGTGVHTLNIPLASTASVTAGLISKTDYDNFNNKVGTGSALAGDVTGTPAATVVDRIKGKSVSAAPTTSGQVLRYTGTQFDPAFISMFDLRSTITGTQAFGGVGCTSGQTLTWTAATDNLSCTNIVVGSSNITDNSIANADLRQSSGLSVIGNAGTATANVADITGTANQVLRVNSAGTALGFGQINLASSAAVTGILPSANLGTGTADATKYLRGDGAWQTLPAGADNLGSHTATQNLNLANFLLVGNGGTAGMAIDSTGRIGIGTASPQSLLDVYSAGGVSHARIRASNTGAPARRSYLILES